VRRNEKCSDGWEKNVMHCFANAGNGEEEETEERGKIVRNKGAEGDKNEEECKI
jgi:hypothetical protein